MKTMKAKMIVLPTNDETGIYYNRDNKLVYTPGAEHLRIRLNQHLYIAVDKEIKEGDWYHWQGTNIIRQCFLTPKSKQQNAKPTLEDDNRKIIYTTDNKLGHGDELGGWYSLPQLSESFIKEYCKAGGIEEVEIECEVSTITKGTDEFDFYEEDTYQLIIK